MTAEQVSKNTSNFRDLLEKCASEFPADVVQVVLGDPSFAQALLELLRIHVEACTGLRTLTLLEPFDFDLIDEKMVEKICDTLYGDVDILSTYPKPVGTQIVSTVLWEENSSLSRQSLDGHYTEKGLTPNPWHLVAIALKQPDFVDKRAIATQWKDMYGNFCYMFFRRWDGRLELVVNRDRYTWSERFLFSGSVNVK